MKILSIVWELCSTASVLVDGVITASVSEERFSRVKNDESYPKRAVEAALDSSGISAADLDYVALAGQRFDPRFVLCHKGSRYSVQDRLREERHFWYPKLYQGRDVNYFELFRDKLDLAQYPGNWDAVLEFVGNGASAAGEADAFFQQFRRQVVCAHLGIQPDRVVFPHHHACHAYYAYYGSPFRQDSVLVLTGDAWGDDMNASVSIAEAGYIRSISTSTNFNLARIYRSMTLLLGMKPDEHEYKVMGLAAYAKPEYYQGPLTVFRNTMYVDGLGFAYREVPPDLYVYFRERLEGYRFDAIAGALQHYAEEILVDWARNCLEATGARRLCFGGGVAMNVKAMMEIAKLPGLDELFVCPSPSDDSLAMGACYLVADEECRRRGADPSAALRPLTNAYLGPDLVPGECASAVERLRAHGGYDVHDHVDLDRVAAVLSSGRIVGRCVGRSEFGARALGNRSILADPRRPDAVRKINVKVKSRDFWMPFAPSILEERAADYLVNPKRLLAPYMTLAFETTLRAQRELVAGLHAADFSCRPQIVSRSANPGYHALLRAFERATGVGGVLNTSFNIHGEPIVQTAADAVDVLNRSELDALILGDHFIEKVT